MYDAVHDHVGLADLGSRPEQEVLAICNQVISILNDSRKIGRTGEIIDVFVRRLYPLLDDISNDRWRHAAGQ